MPSRSARLIAAPSALVAIGLSATTLEPADSQGLWQQNEPKPISYQVLGAPSASAQNVAVDPKEAEAEAEIRTAALTTDALSTEESKAASSAKPETETPAENTSVKRKKPAEAELPPVPRSFGEWIASTSHILIDQGERRLYFKRRDGTVDSAPIAVGRNGFFTPTGQFRVTEIRSNPTWYPTPSMKREARQNGERLPDAVPPGPHNPLGKYFIRFKPEYGIHGTNEPNSIGQAISRGCVRMLNDDVGRLVSNVAVGDGVTIVSGLGPTRMPEYYYEPYKDLGTTAPVASATPRYPVYTEGLPRDSLLQPPTEYAYDPVYQRTHDVNSGWGG